MGLYIRHRDRMVQESVFEDLRNTLIACRWMDGATRAPVRDPATPTVFNSTTGAYDNPPSNIITTALKDILPLLEGTPVSLIDYFPELEGTRPRNEKTPMNTFAMDSGQADDPQESELGSRRAEQMYTFNFAFYAISDAVAIAVMNDLRDRYSGRIVNRGAIDLYDWVNNPTTPVASLDIETFRYVRPDDQVTTSEVHLYFGELSITDFIDA